MTKQSPVVEEKADGFFDTVVDFFDSYSWLVSLIALIIAVISVAMASGVSSGIAGLQLQLNNLDDSVDDIGNDVSSLKSTTSKHTDDIATVKNSINTINADIDDIQHDITGINDKINSIETIQTNISNIESHISDIDNSISDLRDDLNKTQIGIDPDVNITFIYYNQNISDGDAYCHIKLNISSNITIKEIAFSLEYPRTNISLIGMSFTPTATFTHANASYFDNYFVYWFKKANHMTATFNVSWSTTDYNTSQLPLSNLIYDLRVNQYYFDADTIGHISG